MYILMLRIAYPSTYGASVAQPRTASISAIPGHCLNYMTTLDLKLTGASYFVQLYLSPDLIARSNVQSEKDAS